MADSTPLTGAPTGLSSKLGRFDVDTVREHRGWFFALGIGLVLLGAASIILPYVATMMTILVLGWLMIVGGLFQGFHAIQNRKWAGWGWELASALAYLIAGALLLAFPITGKLTLTLVLAAFFAASGFFKILRAIQHRAMPRWGWLLFDGLISLALGVMIAAGWPSTAVWALGLLVGIDLVFSGSSMLVIAFAAGPSLGERPHTTAHAT